MSEQEQVAETVETAVEPKAEFKGDWESFAKAVIALAGQFKIIGVAVGAVEIVAEKELRSNAFAILPVVPPNAEGAKDFRRLAQSFSFQLQDAVYRAAEEKYEAAAKGLSVEEEKTE